MEVLIFWPKGFLKETKERLDTKAVPLDLLSHKNKKK